MTAPFGEDPGYGEQLACWLEPGGSACAAYRDARYQRELEAAAHEADLAAEAQAALAARGGYEDAVNRAQLTQALLGVAVVGPAVLLVVGGIAAYLWWRRQDRYDPTAVNQLSDAELEYILSRRQSR